MTYFEQDPPQRLYLAVVRTMGSDNRSYVYRSKPYPKLSTARMRQSSMKREWGDEYRDGWIETTGTQWARVDGREPGKRRRCEVCRKLSLSVFDREVPDRDRSELSCADCFDRLIESHEELMALQAQWARDAQREAGF